MGKITAGSSHIAAKASHHFTLSVEIDSCKPGMIIAENLYNGFGAIIIKENTVLNVQMISKLKEIDIKRIKIYNKSVSLTLTDSIKSFEESYINNLSILKDVFRDLSANSKVEIDKVDQIAGSIVKNSNENSYVLKHSITDDIDEYLYTHSINVGMLAMLIARWLEYDEETSKAVVKAGILHDIGKAKIDPRILNKRGPLLPNEYDIVRKHVLKGFELIKDMPNMNRNICMGIIMHHERVDGSGYPRGLKNNEINEFAKIIAVADVYDAMTSNRVYRMKQSPFDVFEYMGNGNMAGLDVKITMTFLENVANYYIGDTFVLSNGELCKVLFINPRQLSRPLVQIGERYVDLSKDRDLKISMIV